MALPPDRVLAGAPTAARFAVADPDSDAARLTVVVSGLAPAPAPSLTGRTLEIAWVPGVGQWGVTVTVTDPEGLEASASFSTEGVDGDVDRDGAIAADWGGGDCDDTDAGVAPGRPEYCDARDEDCDGEVDEEAVDAVAVYPDGDGDHYGDDDAAELTCEAQLTSILLGGDCADGDPLVYPGQARIGIAGCDGVGLAWEWTGEARGDRAGDNVRDGGDLDGDGLSEVLICAPEHGGNAGAVYVAGATAPGKAGLGDAPVRLLGERPGDGAGYDFLSPGDLDGDGAGDLLVGAAGYDGALGGEGAVYVVLGPFSGESPLADSYARLVGSAAGDQLGDVASGDLDGDGLPELILGARHSDAGGTDAGEVLVLRGLPPPGESRVGDLAVTRLLGPSAGAIAGDPFPVGDLDGDGLDDVAIATQEDETAGPHGGAVYLVLAPLPPGDVVLDTADSKLVGEAGTLTGHAADGAGDLDGDGRSDLVVGSPYAAPNGANSGTASIVLGPGPPGVVSLAIGAAAILQGEQPQVRAGFSVSRLGDMTGDRLPDLAIGAKYDSTAGPNAGAVHLVPGPFAGTTELGSAGVKLLGEAAGDLAGDVGSVSDGDGDGVPDLLVGARHAAETGAEAGSAYLVFGAPF